MILYYVPGACSLANHIALVEVGLDHARVSVDRQKRTSDGRDFLTINPKGCVPTLELDDGSVLTENLAILTYIAEQRGTLLPTGIARARVLEALSFLTTEVHTNFKPFFRGAPEPEKDFARTKLLRHFALLADQLGERTFLVGDAMTIADPYLFVMLRWAASFAIEVPSRLGAHLARMSAIPSVARALGEEGLA